MARFQAEVVVESRYIVSDEHRFVYCVVPKVACSSIKVALLPLFDLDPSEYRVSKGKDGSAIKIHELFADSSYQIGRRQFLKRFEKGRYDDYFKFAFVRNPWDRLVSCWRHKLSNENRPSGMKYPAKLAERLYGGMPFSEFVEVVAETPDSEANLHFQSQISMVRGDSGGEAGSSLLPDFIGSFENLGGDFETAVRKIGVKEKLELGHLMRSKRDSRSYADFYDERLRDIVRERFREDVETFGYSF